VIALDYLFAAGRFTAAFFGAVNLDAVFFMITNGFGSAMVIPIVFLSLYVITRKTLPGIIGAVVIGLVWIIWLGLIYSGGLSFETHVITYWYSKWQYNSTLSGPISVYGLYLPGAVAALTMFFGLVRAQSKLARYRLIMTICSMILTGTLIMVDFLLTDPVIAVWIRSAILAAVLLGALGYFPPKFIRKGLEEE